MRIELSTLLLFFLFAVADIVDYRIVREAAREIEIKGLRVQGFKGWKES